jgi:hypothetical protein
VFEADDIRDWRTYNVIDRHGAKIGSLEAVYYDTTTQQPTFASVQIGLTGRHTLAFVPLDGARVSPTYLRVTETRRPSRTPPPSNPTANYEPSKNPPSTPTTASPTPPAPTGNAV